MKTLRTAILLCGVSVFVVGCGMAVRFSIRYGKIEAGIDLTPPILKASGKEPIHETIPPLLRRDTSGNDAADGNDRRGSVSSRDSSPPPEVAPHGLAE